MKINIKIFLIIVFIISVFVDMYTGYSMLYLKRSTNLQLVVKGLIILYSLPYLIRGNKVSNTIFAGVLLVLISTAYWVVCGYTNLGINYISNIARLIYPYCLFLVLYSNKDKFTNDDILHYTMYYGLIASLSILLLDFLDLGFSSYNTTDFGYGVKGFFAAGNDTSVTLILCTCITSYYVSNSNKKYYIIYNVIMLIACFRIGTRAANLGALIISILLVVQSLLIKPPFSNNYYKYKSFLLLCGIPIAIYSLFTIAHIDSYMIQKYSISGIMGGNIRGALINAFNDAYSRFSTLDYLLGVGPEEFSSRIGLVLFNINRYTGVEVDHLELIAYYGYILGLLIIIFPIIYFYKYIISFFKNRQTITLWLSTALLFFIIHGFIAGHAYTSVQASTIMVGLLFYKDKK